MKNIIKKSGMLGLVFAIVFSLFGVSSVFAESTPVLKVQADGQGQVAAVGEDDEEVEYYDSITITEAGDYTLYAQAEDDYVFAGWTKDGEEYSEEEVIEITFSSEDIEMVAVFVYNEEEYSYMTADGVEITFTDEYDTRHTFDVIDVTAITDDDLEEMAEAFDMDYDEIKEAYDKAMSYGEEAAGTGTLIKLYDMYLYGTNGTEIHELDDSSFGIRIAITDEMKGYDSYKLVYIDEDGVTDEEYELTVDEDGEYLVGSLDHLSLYALVGTTVSTPDSGSMNVFETGSAVASTGLISAVAVIAAVAVSYRFVKRSIRR